MSVCIVQLSGYQNGEIYLTILTLYYSIRQKELLASGGLLNL